MKNSFNLFKSVKTIHVNKNFRSGRVALHPLLTYCSKATGQSRGLPRFIMLLLLFAASVLSQDLPREIRGYKVHKEKIAVVNGSDKSGAMENWKAFIKVGEPDLVDVSLTGITLTISAEIKALEQSGKVDFLTFHDFRINGLEVEIEEYTDSFSFRKNENITLPKPARLFLPTEGILRGAWKEIKESKHEWTVTGRVFVFGKFRKMGFKFKRVVPIEIRLTIKNPLLGLHS